MWVSILLWLSVLVRILLINVWFLFDILVSGMVRLLVIVSFVVIMVGKWYLNFWVLKG